MWRAKPSPSTKCALVVAIPLSRSEFAHDFSRGREFVHGYVDRLQKPVAEAWHAYEPYARRCSAVIEAVRAAGVSVIPRAPLASFHRTTATFEAVTLVAHSRGPEVTPRDIVCLSTVRSRLSDIATVLTVDELTDACADETTISAWIDGALGPVEVDSEHDGGDASRAQAYRVELYQKRWDRRRAVESVCGSALAGGPAIEFDDGLASIAAIDAGIPTAMPTIDLTVCDSVLLAEYLRRSRTGGAILANPRPATPDFGLTLYEETIRFMNRHRVTYVEAALRLRRALMRNR